MLSASRVDVLLIVDLVIGLRDNPDEQLLLQVSRPFDLPAPPQCGLLVIVPTETSLVLPETLTQLAAALEQPEITAVAFHLGEQHYIAHCLPGEGEEYDAPYGPSHICGYMEDSVQALNALTDGLNILGWKLEHVTRMRTYSLQQKYWHVLYTN